MPRMGEGESFAGRGQGGPQAAARSAASGLRPLKPPGGRLGLRPEAGGIQKHNRRCKKVCMRAKK